MAARFMRTVLTPSVLAAQAHYFGRSAPVPGAPERDPLTDEERLFIEARDSFYMATVSEGGWPYLQHRGGAPGFLRVLGPDRLAFADYPGNRQLLSTGNLMANDRVALFLMDYPNRERLKILGHAQVLEARLHPELAAQFAGPGARRSVERIFVIDVLSFDWNCPQYITPRYTAAEWEAAGAPPRQPVADRDAGTPDQP
jgi:predicted pyridoxine 5'-phosphate oxidase superfamily flavin-nucleotide-binding protein